MKNVDELFVPLYARTGVPIVEGKGCTLIDANGREYLDFTSGIAVNTLGYAHPQLEETLIRQGKRLLHASNLFYNDMQTALAQELVEKSFGDRIFFCNSGTEANEAAIKFARKVGSKKQSSKTAILSFHESFHGRTYAAMTATGQKKFHEGFHPLPSGFFYAPFNDIDATKQVLDGADFAAIIVEPIQGEGGLTLITPVFLRFLRDYATEHDIVLIFDEIQCGMGRTGTLWAYEHFGIAPDILTVAKPLGGGLPLGATITTAAIADVMAPGDHGTTFGGNPLACALGKTLIDIVSVPEFLTTVQEKGLYLRNRLLAVTKTNPEIIAVVGLGLLAGVRLNIDPKDCVQKAADLGLLLVKAGKNTVRFIPPLIVEKEDLDRAVDIFILALEQSRS